MKRFYVHGIGAVSPAGWDVNALRQALDAGVPVEPSPFERPGWKRPLLARRVPLPAPKMAFLAHARLRRASPMSIYAAAAANEALQCAGYVSSAGHQLGIIFCVTAGCVQYSRRFYDDAWRNPATAAPVLFPETVFNAPASHLSALLDSQSVNYTLVGDPGTFLQALALAGGWLSDGRVDGCLVVGAEEMDWLTADAYRHFSRGVVCGEGAGALYLSCEPPGEKLGAELVAITSPQLYLNGMSGANAIKEMRSELPSSGADAVLSDSLAGWPKRDRAEREAWSDWKGARISPRKILGEGLMAACAWQCVAAIDRLRQGRNPLAMISMAGSHQQAIGACFSTIKNG